MEKKTKITSILRSEHEFYDNQALMHSKNVLIWLLIGMLDFLVITGLQLQTLSIFGWIGIIVCVVLILVEYVQYKDWKTKQDKLNSFYLTNEIKRFNNKNRGKIYGNFKKNKK